LINQALAQSEAAIETQSVRVIRAGQMGSGIAQVCALAGFDLWLNDVSVDRIDAGLPRIANGVPRQLASGAHSL
jgi:3-hydroxybutyryl-CoA dehydrogenase